MAQLLVDLTDDEYRAKPYKDQGKWRSSLVDAIKTKTGVVFSGSCVVIPI